MSAKSMDYVPDGRTRFQSMQDAPVDDQHLGRRSVSDFQRGVLALRKREIVAERRAAALAASALRNARRTTNTTRPATQSPRPLSPSRPPTLSSREAIARAARLSSSQVVMIG